MRSFYLFSVSDRNIKHTSRRIVWEEMSVRVTQATFCPVYIHCCRHFTHQMDIVFHFMHTVLISALCVL